MTKYRKLVRDKIPAIIEANGETPRYRVLADDEEFLAALLQKDVEEGIELAQDPNIDEITDKLEVLYAIAETRGYTREEIERARADKAEKRGGFSGRIFLEGVEQDEQPTLPVFISGNLNKVTYLSKTLGIELEHQKIDLDEIQSADPKAVIEHKVRQAYDLIKKPVLVEDTSLSFNALGGLPGPLIKFFVDANNGLENMCRMLDGFDDRSAYGSVIYGYYDGDNLRFFEGRLDGTIAAHPRGEGGYGWDRIFEPVGYGGLTRAELSAEQDLESYNKLRDTIGLRDFLLN